MLKCERSSRWTSSRRGGCHVQLPDGWSHESPRETWLHRFQLSREANPKMYRTWVVQRWHLCPELEWYREECKLSDFPHGSFWSKPWHWQKHFRHHFLSVYVYDTCATWTTTHQACMYLFSCIQNLDMNRWHAEACVQVLLGMSWNDVFSYTSTLLYIDHLEMWLW